VKQPLHIDAVVFDLGKVLIDFDYAGLVGFLLDHGFSFHSKEDLLKQMRYFAYERGEIGDDDFLANLQKKLKRPAEEQALVDKWQQVFEPIPEMLDLAHRISRSHRVFVISNTNSLHWHYLIETFAVDRIGEGQLTSWETGVRKPDAGIFRHAERAFSLQAAHTVFIDDLEENARGAAALGWNTIHHRSPEATREALHDMGIV
jgi:putative hydrolase of the HAD superfamily